MFSSNFSREAAELAFQVTGLQTKVLVLEEAKHTITLEVEEALGESQQHSDSLLRVEAEKEVQVVRVGELVVQNGNLVNQLEVANVQSHDRQQHLDGALITVTARNARITALVAEAETRETEVAASAALRQQLQQRLDAVIQEKEASAARATAVEQERVKLNVALEEANGVSLQHQQQLEIAAQARVELSARVNAAEQELDRRSVQLEAANGAAHQLQMQLDSAVQQGVARDVTIKDLTADVAALAAECDGVRTEVVEERAGRIAAERSLAASIQRLQQVEAEKVTLAASVTAHVATSTDLRELLDQLQLRLDTLEEEKVAMAARVTSGGGECDRLRMELAGERARAIAAEGDVTARMEAAVQLEVKLVEATAAVTKLEAIQVDLTHSLEAANATVAAKNGDLVALSQQRDQLQVECLASTAAVTRLEATADGLAQELVDAKATIVTQAVHIADLQHQFDEAVMEVRCKETEMEALQQRNDDVEGSRAELTKKVCELEGEVALVKERALASIVSTTVSPSTAAEIVRGREVSATTTTSQSVRSSPASPMSKACDEKVRFSMSPPPVKGAAASSVDAADAMSKSEDSKAFAAPLVAMESSSPTSSLFAVKPERSEAEKMAARLARFAPTAKRAADATLKYEDSIAYAAASMVMESSSPTSPLPAVKPANSKSADAFRMTSARPNGAGYDDVREHDKEWVPRSTYNGNQACKVFVNGGSCRNDNCIELHPLPKDIAHFKAVLEADELREAARKDAGRLGEAPEPNWYKLKDARENNRRFFPGWSFPPGYNANKYCNDTLSGRACKFGAACKHFHTRRDDRDNAFEYRKRKCPPK